MDRVLAIIPARSGSKGIPNKNIKSFNGYPLIYWSIKQAQESKYINRIIVSTDSEEYAEVVRSHGTCVPFLRPSAISQDRSTDYECIRHCLEWLKENENYKPDIIVQLRPTYPTRSIKKLDEMIEIFMNNNNYDSLRTVIPFEKSPYKMYRIKNNTLRPLFKEVNNISEPYNQCRQVLPECYLHNGYVDIMKYNTIYKKQSVTGEKILPYIMNKDEVDDIDTINDWVKAEISMKKMMNK